MKISNFSKIISLFILLSIFTIPAIAFAADPNPVPPNTSARFTNPLGDGVTIYDLIQRVTNWLLGIAASLALVSIMVAGIKLLVSSIQGDEKGMESAKKIVMMAIFGLVLIALAFIIVRAIPLILTGAGGTV